MRLSILAVGKLRPAYRALADEYLRRLGRYAPTMETEVREAGKAPSPNVARRQEAARLRERLPPGVWRVALDRQGRGWTSEQVAERLDGWRKAARPVALLIGGSHGLDGELLGECEEQWSLGPATLPHELARIVVCEQVYRAWTILRREPYHK